MKSLLIALSSGLMIYGATAASSPFDITKTPADYRREYCNVQQAYCQSFCGGQSNVKINFCSTCSLQWNCECVNPALATFPNAPNSVFPMQYYQCVGEKDNCLRQCQDEFGAQTALTDQCQFTQCQAKFQCGSTFGGEKVVLRVAGDGSNITCSPATTTDTSASTSPLNTILWNSAMSLIAAFLLLVLV